MISSPQPNLYVSDEGFSVEVLGRAGLMYRQGDREAEVDSEVLLGPSGMAVYPESIREWETPSGKIPITDDEKKVILDRIKAVFAFQGFEIEIIGQA